MSASKPHREQHHYSLSSMLGGRQRTSSKTKNSTGGAHAGRDNRQSQAQAQVQAFMTAAGSKAYSAQDPASVPRSMLSPRPPSTPGYRTQQAQVPGSAFPAGIVASQSLQHQSQQQPQPQQPPSSSSASRPFPSAQRSGTGVAQPSSSKTHLEVPEPRGYFSKMFHRVRSTSTSRVPSGSETEKPKGSSRPHRSNSVQVQPTASLVTPTASMSPSQAGPSSNVNPYGTFPRAGTGSMPSATSAVAPSQHDAEREERAKRRAEKAAEKAAREDRARAERAKEEKAKADYSVYRNKLDAEQVTSIRAATRADGRSASKREEKKLQSQLQPQPQQEYDSDTARRRSQVPTAPQARYVPNAPTNSSSTQYLSPNHQQPIQRDVQPTPLPQTNPLLRHPGVPIQPSSSSQSTGSISLQNANTAGIVRTSTPPLASKMNPLYLPSNSDDKSRAPKDSELDREKAKEKEEKRLRRDERERLKGSDQLEREREKLREYERTEQERAREKERDKAADGEHRSKHRHRDKSHSMPVNPLPGTLSGSDTEKATKRESINGRHHRSHSHAVPAQMQQAGTGVSGPELKRDTTSATPSTFAQNSTQTAPSIPQLSSFRHEQIFRSASEVPHSHQNSPPRLPDRARTDPVTTRDSVFGSSHTTFTTAPWTQPQPQPLPHSVQAKLVTIHAAQGPPDHASLQKPIPAMPSTTEQNPVTSSASILPGLDGHTRISSHDYSMRYGETYTSPYNASASASQHISSSVPQVAPSHTSSSSSRQHASTPQSQRMSSMNVTNSMSSAQHTPPTRPDLHDSPTGKNVTSPGASGLLSPQSFGPQQMSVPVPSNSSHDQARSVPNTSPSAPQTYMYATSQTKGGSPKSQNSGHGNGSPHVPQPGYVSRASSNNSTHSVQRATLQVPSTSQSGAYSIGMVARTPSSASQTTENGASQHLHAPPPTQSRYSSSVPTASGTSMYSSGQNTSTSRAPYTPLSASFNQQTASSAHSSSQLPSSASSYPNNIPNVQNALPRSDIRSPPVSAPNSASANHQQYSTHPPPRNSVQYSNSASAYAQLYSQQSQTHASSQSNYATSSNSHPHPSHNDGLYSSSSGPSASNMLSSQPSQSSATVYNNLSSPRSPDPTHRTSYTVPRSAGYQQGISQVVYSHIDSSKTPRPSDVMSNTIQTSSGPYQPSAYTSVNTPTAASFKSPDLQSRGGSSAQYVTSTRQTSYAHDPTTPGPPLTPTPAMNASSSQTIAQPTPIRSQNAATSTSTRVAVAGYTSGQNADNRLQDFDSPPPLTPSSTSSHEEILMTPSSLDPAKGQPQEVSVTIQRPEKKKGGLFGLFRSNSRSRERREDEPSNDPESSRLQTSGPVHRSDSGGNKLVRLSRQATATPSSAPAVMATGMQSRTEPVNNPGPVKLTKPSKHIPPPISIPPPQVLQYRILSSKSKRYRTMSAASLEALDGTANNTVVGSPTSTVRSPTPSGPLTPPIRDPLEAAHEWRNNEERVYNDRGTQRRRRPGVTFDLNEEDAMPKSSGNYRLARASRIYGQRGDGTD